jgi:hypothetical protein
MALTQEQLEILADRSKLIYAQKDEEKRSAEIVKVTAGYGDDMGLAYKEIMTNLKRYQQLANENVGIDPATANFVVPSGATNTSATFGFNSQGYSGVSAEFLAGVSLPKGAGTSLGVGGGVTVNGENKITSGQITANYAGDGFIKDPGVPVELLPVLKPTATIGEDGGKSANVLAGLVTAQSNGLTHTDGVIFATDGTGTQLHRTAIRVDKPFGIEGLDTSVNVVTTATVLDEDGKFGVKNVSNGINLFNKLDIGGGNSFISNVGVQATEMEKAGFKNWGVGGMIGFTTGGASAPPAEQNFKSEPANANYNLNVLNANEAARNAATAIPNLAGGEVTGGQAAAVAPASAIKNLDYNFLELSEKEQQKVLTLMAETYKNTHPDVSTKEAKAVI